MCVVYLVLTFVSSVGFREKLTYDETNLFTFVSVSFFLVDRLSEFGFRFVTILLRAYLVPERNP
jgi:hypothetical protein